MRRTLQEVRAAAAAPANAFDAGYLFPFACFACRRSFKRPYSAAATVRKCPHCGGKAVMLDRKFKPPKATDVKQWLKVQRVVEAGFRFGSASRSGAYPATLREVDAFVREFEPWGGCAIVRKPKRPARRRAKRSPVG